MMRVLWRAAALTLAVAGLAGCLSTARPDDLTHYVLVERVPPAVSPSPPFYLVGIEKFSAALVGRIQPLGQADCAGDRTCFNIAGSPSRRVESLWLEAMSDRTQMVVSHIVEISGDRCRPVAPLSSLPACPVEDRVQGDPPVENSWALLETEFYAELAREARAREATHIVVMAPGWNNSQVESIETFRKWAAGVSDALGDQARPIFIGISWPAARRGLPLIHFLNKAHDSDEAGFTWANVLVNRTLARLRDEQGVRVVLIGHSFGARLLSDAAFTGFAIDAPCESRGADMVIGLQGAFSTSRFIGPNEPDAEVFGHARQCRGVAAYTASRHDNAVVWAPSQIVSTNSGYVGGARGLETARGSGFFTVTTADAAGEAGLPLDAKVLMVDASAFVDGHGDVSDQAMFHLIGSLIRRYAPAATRP